MSERARVREALEGLRVEMLSLRGEAAGQRAGIEALRAEMQNARENLNGLRGEAAGQRAGIDALRAEMQNARENLNGLREHVGKVDAEVGGMREWLQSVSARDAHDREASAEAFAELAQRVPDSAPLYAPGAFQLERFDAGLGGEVVGFRGDGDDRGARVYVGFEDYFRGSEELIRDRQLAYLPVLSARGRVLDVGCGRGEFLDLMRDAGVEATGIDLDGAMVEHCLSKGLAVVQADAVAFLQGLPSGSLEAVFAAQVIEHLSYADLLGFLRLACEKLAPSGILIVETVNPHCPQALKNFWIDPTHRNPLFPETVMALCRLTGFAEAYVWHPQGSGDPDRDRLEQPDYAVVATTPNAAGGCSTS
jgi:2-polyprenyl-3-methyl-5-hydroxy-6-metoxy-1,4-benzoquinol methylase